MKYTLGLLFLAGLALGQDFSPVLPEFKFGTDGRIVGGNEAKPHSIPYQVALALQVGDKQAFCGGSLISNQYVLTAAHCTDQASNVTVYLGAHNIKESNEAGQLRIQVPKENLIVHEKWSMLTLTNDISLIKLPEPVEFNEQIQPINLPKRSQEKDKFDGYQVIASGWGKDSDKSTTVSPVLRVINVPVVGKLKCTIFYLGRVKKTHICAGVKGQSTCQGDSGGPLAIVEEDGSRTVVGLTSFGIAFGCELGWPGVFTRITSYLDWIADNSGIQIRA